MFFTCFYHTSNNCSCQEKHVEKRRTPALFSKEQGIYELFGRKSRLLALSQSVQQIVNSAFGSGPACDEAVHNVFFVDDPLHLELKAHGGQLFGGLDLHDRELLVGGGGDRELIAQRLEAVPQTESRVIGVTADVEVEIVLQQRLELYAQQPFLTF